MSEPIMMLARAINAHKADALGTSALLLAVIKSFTPEQRSKVLEEFEEEISLLRSELARSNLERDISDGVESYVRSIEARCNSLGRD